MAITDDLYTLERGFWEQGGDYYRANLAETVLMAFVDMAGTQPRAAVAETVPEVSRWRDVEMRHKGLIEPVPDVAIITYEASATRADGTPYAALVSSGYAREGTEGWKMMFHAQAPMSG